MFISVIQEQDKRNYQFAEVFASVQEMGPIFRVIVLIDALPKPEPKWRKATDYQVNAQHLAIFHFGWNIFICFIILMRYIKYSNPHIL